MLTVSAPPGSGICPFPTHFSPSKTAIIEPSETLESLYKISLTTIVIGWYGFPWYANTNSSFASLSVNTFDAQFILASASKYSLALKASGKSANKFSGTFADNKLDCSVVVASTLSELFEEPISFDATI